MSYPNPALEAELAYRHEQIAAALRPAGRRSSWFARRRRAH